MKKYFVYDRESGLMVAQGTAKDCAAALRLTYGSFLTIGQRSRKGKTSYVVESTDEWEEEFVKKWDESFGWARMETIEYPCNGCMLQSSCGYADTYCKKWEKWYKAAHDHASMKLKKCFLLEKGKF